MKDFISNIGKKISEFWNKLKKGQRAIIIIGAVVMIIAIIVVLAVSGQTKYVTLFSGMDSAEAGEVLQKLQSDNVDAQVVNGSVLVPEEQVEQLRLQLNAQGYPKTGLNYDLYLNNAATFGMTDTERRNLYKMQLEQNITQTLRAMGKIKNATVIVTLAPESKYVLSKTENEEAAASVMLELADGQTLSTSEANTVRTVVRTAVQGLKDENITIADTNMNSYSAEDQMSGNLGSDVTGQLQLTQQVKKMLEQQLVSLYAPVFGEENLTASVNVKLNFDKSTTTSIELSPVTDVGEEDNIGIITELKRTRERVMQGTETAEGEPGVESNGGGATSYQEIDRAAGDDTYYKVTEEYNARVNEINETLEKAQGQIESISCTLIINGGDELEDVLPDVRQQISTAIGVQLNNVTVSAQSFYQSGEEEDPNNPNGNLVPEGVAGNMTLIFIIAGVLVLAFVLIIILMSKSNKKKRLAMQEQQRQWMEEQQNAMAMAASLAGDEEGEVSPEDLLRPQESDNLTQIKMLVDKDPAAIAQLLRNWLTNNYSGR